MMLLSACLTGCSVVKMLVQYAVWWPESSRSYYNIGTFFQLTSYESKMPHRSKCWVHRSVQRNWEVIQLLNLVIKMAEKKKASMRVKVVYSLSDKADMLYVYSNNLCCNVSFTKRFWTPCCILFISEVRYLIFFNILSSNCFYLFYFYFYFSFFIFIFKASTKWGH